MSPFRTEPCTVALCPTEIGIFRPAHGQRSAVAAAEETTALTVAPVDGAPLWQGAADTFAAWLAHAATPRLQIDLVLSNRFARFAVVPWSDAVTGERESEMVAMLAMESLYGDMTGWTVSLDAGAWGQPRLACAVESGLIERLREVLTMSRVACCRIEPFFVTCWNRWHGAFEALEARDAQESGDGLLVVTEAMGPTVLATIRAGRWHAVRAVGGKQDSLSLAQLLDREVLLQGFEVPPVRWLHAAGVATDALPADIRVLQPVRSHSSVAVGMALTGGGA